MIYAKKEHVFTVAIVIFIGGSYFVAGFQPYFVAFLSCLDTRLHILRTNIYIYDVHSMIKMLGKTINSTKSGLNLKGDFLHCIIV